MVGFAHVVLHLTLCQAAANLPASASIPVQIRLHFATNRLQPADQNFTIKRGEAMQHTVEFDAPRGTVRAVISAPSINCNAIDYWAFLSEQNRTIAETLVDGVPPEPHPLLMFGLAPQSFLYLNPTYVIFDKSTACNAQVGDPIPANFRVEDDDSSFYVWLNSDPDIDARGTVVVALQIATPTGEYHYIRLKVPFPHRWDGFAYSYTYNVKDDDVQWLAGQPVDTLLCPKMFMTSGG